MISAGSQVLGIGRSAVRRARGVRGSGYLRAIGKLASGQGIATLLLLLAAPLLGRLYTPADYGILASYMALSGLFGVLATLQLHHGIIAEASERRAELLVLACGVLAAGASGLAALLGVALFFVAEGHAIYGAMRAWLLLLPLSVFLPSVSIAVAVLANRRRRYGTLARIPVYNALASIPLSIAFGLAGWGADGLLASFVIGQALIAFVHWRLYRSMVVWTPAAGAFQLRALAHRHRHFSLYTLPSEFLSTVNLNAPVYALGALGSVAVLGNYSRALRIVGGPITLLGQSIAMVFRQRAAEDYRRTGSCRPIFRKTFLTLLGIGLAPTLVIVAFGPQLFIWFLGPNWAEAGEIAKALAPMLLLRMAASPISSVFQFTGSQRYMLVIQLIAGMLIAIPLLMPLLLGAAPVVFVYNYAASYMAVYIITLVLAWRVAAK